MHDLGIRDQPGWEQHAQFMDRLIERGVVVLGGPIASDDQGEVALLAVEAIDEKELRSVVAEDPWVVSGVLLVKHVQAWTIWLGGPGGG
jgi:uncharacterized protein YciI